MTVQIRDATAADAGALAGLLAELGYPVAADQVPGRLEMFKVEGNGRVVVAVVDGAVRAFAAVEITYPIHQRRPVAHLTAFAVSSSVRRQGVGRTLLAAVEQVAADEGCGQVVVTSAEHRADAHAFYPSAGWGPTGRRFGKAIDRRSSQPSEPRLPRRVIVAYPKSADQAAWQPVLAVRDRFDPLAASIAPHLTLVFPFEDPLSDDELREHIRQATSAAAPFDITLGGITAHENEYLFLNVKRGNDALIQLHDRLYSGPLSPYLVRRNTFVPHVTVGRVSAASLAAALEATAKLVSPIEARVDNVSVYRIEPNGARTDIFDLPLAHA
jgi:2'-5' RNA ligase/GNAT superfamily N-acetyltransferase